MANCIIGLALIKPGYLPKDFRKEHKEMPSEYK
jgi:hypothetical protein